MEVGRLSLHHLNGGNSQRPDIHFVGVASPADQLRSHPEGRPHHTLSSLLLHSADPHSPYRAIQSHREAEIGQLHLALPVDQDVVALDIYASPAVAFTTSMNAVVGMQGLQRAQNALADICEAWLAEADLFTHDAGETALAHELHDDPQLILPVKAVAHVNDIGMTGGLLKRELVLDIQQLAQVRHFDRNHFLRFQISGLVHRTEAARTDYLLNPAVIETGIFVKNERF